VVPGPSGRQETKKYLTGWKERSAHHANTGRRNKPVVLEEVRSLGRRRPSDGARGAAAVVVVLIL